MLVRAVAVVIRVGKRSEEVAVDNSEVVGKVVIAERYFNIRSDLI